MQFEQSPLGDQQVGQAEQREQLRGVVGQTAVADLLSVRSGA
jgi:hypothetical protein